MSKVKKEEEEESKVENAAILLIAIYHIVFERLGNLPTCNSLPYTATFSRGSCQSDHTWRFNNVVGIVA